ncbi:PREDICTED: serrate RNA effector molecule homolog [Priapulus caudatus]|uniref:Serrate RNA effector molecule homolog n=1 Tax=Priapulus caudatus TaxID=37621 RepID=A0ABM1EZN8_PRICU|nr:PREDICTED: serrate RNA effector molecule homolog [Priapulus caudatus]
MEMDMTSKERELQKKAKEFLKKKQEKTEGDYKYDDDEDSGAEVDPAEQPAPPGIEAGTSAPAAEKEEGEGDDDSQDASSEKAKKEEKNKEMKESEEGQENGDAEEGEEKEETVAPVVPLKSTKPRPLHKTLSIFLRNLAPSITKQEVEAMCKRFPGYIRVALSEPQPERKFFRRGWVTFSRDVNIKEICWNLNNIRLRDCEMGPIVNRDLQRRIRPVNGIAAHKQVMKNDISLAARVVCNLDRQRHLWLDPGAEKKEKTKLKFGVDSRNPLLKNITDYFIDEMSAEEEELIGKAEEAEKSESTIDRDNTLCQVLDKMILYLRIVHSLDFYNASDYPLEDEMPNRCGIMHCRGPTPINPVSQEDVTEFVKTFSEKIEPFLQVDEKLTEDDAISLGKKDPEAEVEKFILANTQELAKDKWLCPLSGKKFKGPDFIRKHLMNKHCEKLDEVRAEVAYFNNYLLDLRRPVAQDQTKMMAQPPMGIPYPQAPQPAASYHPRPQPSYGGYAGGGGGYRGGYNQGADAGFSRGGGREYHNRSGRGRYGDRRDPRDLIQYQDLDAPNDYDIF